MRRILLSLAFLLVTTIAHAEPFEIKDGDRVLFLGDTLLEREGTYGYLETRMVEQFPDRRFTVRNLAFSADTPLGWSRASFDPAAKGFERLKEQLALVKPTVVFLGYGMAASLQEMTDRSQDWTLNRDPARYGAEPMSAARFKKELAQCMDAIISTTENTEGTEGKKDAPASPSVSSVPSVVKKSPVRFVLLSPIRHEDLRATRPGLPDPTEHNKLLEQYSKAIEELAKERGARFVDLFNINSLPTVPELTIQNGKEVYLVRTENGIHLSQDGYMLFRHWVARQLGWPDFAGESYNHPLAVTIRRKNELFFHRWRPANETYLFGFRKREQGQNAVEIPKFDPLIEAAEAEIERLKKAPATLKGAGMDGVPPDSKLRLPIAKDAKVPAGPQRDVVTVRIFVRDGRVVYEINGKTYAQAAELIEPLKLNAGKRLVLATEKNAKYADIKAVLEAVGSAGFSEVAFTAKEVGELAQPAPVTSLQSPVTSPDPARQTPAEKPGLSKLPAPFASQPHPTFTLADGLEISLWAENPLLAKPTQMNWDAQGRLWVASSAMYPQIAPGQVAFDKIIILEDPGHAGKATKATVFVDGLLIPTGVAPVMVQGKSAQSSVPSAQKSGAAGSSLSTDPLSTEHSKPHWACYVGQSTELLHFEDTDDDGKADKKRIVLSGFGTEDTHHIIHTLRWGPDGRLYFSQSVYIHTHLETPWGVVRLNSGGVFAYDPRTERVEVFSRGLWNTWGHAWDKWGQSFLTDGAGSTGLSWGFPGATFAPNEGARRTMASISPGNYPKFAGLEIIYSPHFPADWQGSAVTCDFRAHKVVHFKINDLSAEGKSGYITEQLPVLVQTSDATFRPIDVKLGPDGALYIADWSNPIINHGEVDFRDPRRDHEHGRIWRLSRKGGKPVKWEKLVGKTAEQLIDALTSDSSWESTNAQRVLIQKAGPQTKEMWGEEVSKDATGVRPALVADLDPGNMLGPWGVAAMWGVAHAVNFDFYRGGPLSSWQFFQVTSLLAGGETSPLTPLRARRAGEWLAQPAYNFESKDETIRHETVRYRSIVADDVLPPLTRSKLPRVRVEAMRAIARIPTLQSASLILDAAINAPKDDPHYEFAAWLSINDLAEVWTKAVLAGEWKPEGREKQFEFALNAIEPALAGQVLSQFVSTGRAPLDGSGPWIELIGNTGGPAELRRLLDGLLAATVPDGDKIPPLADAKHKFKVPGANARAAAALVAAARRGVKPAGVPLGDWRFYFYAPEDSIADIVRLSGLWKENVTNAIGAHIGNNTDAKLLDACFESLRLLGTGEAAKLTAAYLGVNLGGKPDDEFVRHTSGNAGPAIRRRALIALATLRPAEATKQLGAVLASVGEQGHLQLWRDLFASQPFMLRFNQAIPKDLPPVAYAAAMRAAREMGRKGDGLANKLAPLAGESTIQVAPADYNDLAARAKQNGDPVAGEALYRRMASACTTCHAIGGAGGKLGPDMTSIGASAPPDYLIESILNPAAKVKEGYHAFTFAMKDGSEAIGIPTRDTPQEQFIRTLAGEQGIPKANIVSKKITEGGASLMPAGLVNSWTDRERLNLYAFLMELGRPGPFDASKNNVARVWQLTEVERVAPRTLSGEETRDGATRSTTPAIYAYTLVDGRLTKDLLAERLAMLAPKNATVHLTARFQAASAGKAKLNLTGIRKAWLDGQPLAIASEPSPSVDLTAGAHTFTVEVDPKSPPEVVRLESGAVSFLGD